MSYRVKMIIPLVGMFFVFGFAAICVIRAAPEVKQALPQSVGDLGVVKLVEVKDAGGQVILNGNTIFRTVYQFAAQAAKPLSAIIKSVEDQKVGVITSVEFDDGFWEVDVHKDNASTEIYLDPQSGAEQRRRPDGPDGELPPAAAKPLSVIIKALEDQKVGGITSVEFDDGFWEVKVRKDGTRTKFDIDPRTGERRR